MTTALNLLFGIVIVLIIITAGLFLSTWVGGLIIRHITHRFTEEIGSDSEGLKDGGKYIGYLERALILLFMLMGEPSGVGFLIAAKSILRFGEIKDTSQRKMSEYIIIGTFLSFGWGLFIAILTRGILRILVRAG
jgi:hypothetical protein